METLKPATIFEDNQGTIKLAENPKVSNRTKHIGVRYHYIRDQIEEGKVTLVYCATKDMVADMMTKALPKEQFKKLRERLGMEFIMNSPCNTRREVLRANHMAESLTNQNRVRIADPDMYKPDYCFYFNNPEGQDNDELYDYNMDSTNTTELKESNGSKGE